MDQNLQKFLDGLRANHEALPKEAHEAGANEELTSLLSAQERLFRQFDAYAQAALAIGEELAFVENRIRALKLKRIPLLSPAQHKIVRDLLDSR
jgi:hypothetical protein